MLDGLASGSTTSSTIGQGTCPGLEGTATAHCGRSNQPIESGQDINVVLDTLADAIKMKRMLEIQWACITIAAMSSATGPRDDSNDDLPELEYDREEYEWRHHWSCQRGILAARCCRDLLYRSFRQLTRRPQARYRSRRRSLFGR